MKKRTKTSRCKQKKGWTVAEALRPFFLTTLFISPPNISVIIDSVNTPRSFTNVRLAVIGQMEWKTYREDHCAFISFAHFLPVFGVGIGCCRCLATRNCKVKISRILGEVGGITYL